jgi:hypothetical protein
MDEEDFFRGVDFASFDLQGLVVFMRGSTNMKGHPEIQKSKIRSSFEKYNNTIKLTGSALTSKEVDGILQDLQSEAVDSFSSEDFYSLLFPSGRFYMDEQLLRVMNSNAVTCIRNAFKNERNRAKQEKKAAKEARKSTSGIVNKSSSKGSVENDDDDLGFDLHGTKDHQQSFEDWWKELEQNIKTDPSLTDLEKFFCEGFYQLCKLKDVNLGHIEEFMAFYVHKWVKKTESLTEHVLKAVDTHTFKEIVADLNRELNSPMPFKRIHDVYKISLVTRVTGNHGSLSTAQLAQLTRILIDAVVDLTNAVPEHAIQKARGESSEEKWWNLVQETLDSTDTMEDLVASLDNAYQCIVHARKNILLSMRRFMNLYVNHWIKKCQESRTNMITDLADVDFDAKTFDLQSQLHDFHGSNFVDLHKIWITIFRVESGRKFRTPTGQQITRLAGELTITIVRNVMVDTSKAQQDAHETGKDSSEKVVDATDVLLELHSDLKGKLDGIQFKDDFIDAFEAAYDCLSESKNLTDASELYPIMHLYVTEWIVRAHPSRKSKTFSRDFFESMLHKTLREFRKITRMPFKTLHDIWTSKFQFEINGRVYHPSNEQFEQLANELASVAHDSIMDTSDQETQGQSLDFTGYDYSGGRASTVHAAASSSETTANKTLSKKRKIVHSESAAGAAETSVSTTDWLVSEARKSQGYSSTKSAAGAAETPVSPKHAPPDQQSWDVPMGSVGGGAANSSKHRKPQKKTKASDAAGKGAEVAAEDDPAPPAAESGSRLTQAQFMAKYGDKIKKGKELLAEWKVGFSSGAIHY